MVSINIVSSSPFLQGGAKTFEAFLKRVGLKLFYFSGGRGEGGAEPQEGMVFSREAWGFSTKKFKPMIKYLILWGQDNKIFSLLTLVTFSSNSLSFLSLYLKLHCFKSCPYLLDFKSHAFWALWVWQTGVFGVKNMLYLFKTWGRF